MDGASFYRRLPGRLLLCLCAATCLNAYGQIPGEQRPPPEAVTPPPPEAAPLEEAKLDQFAEAYLSIEEIHKEAQVELERTQDPDAASEIRLDAETRIIKAVERSGLRLDEFNQIAELMAVDLELRDKVASKVAQRRRI